MRLSRQEVRAPPARRHTARACGAPGGEGRACPLSPGCGDAVTGWPAAPSSVWVRPRACGASFYANRPPGRCGKPSGSSGSHRLWGIAARLSHFGLGLERLGLDPRVCLAAAGLSGEGETASRCPRCGLAGGATCRAREHSVPPSERETACQTSPAGRPLRGHCPPVVRLALPKSRSLRPVIGSLCWKHTGLC